MLKPVKKSMQGDYDTQLNKIYDEAYEIMSALDVYKQERTDKARLDCAKEIVDVQVACETMLDMLGFDEGTRDAVRSIVYHKNKSRGYYDDEKDMRIERLKGKNARIKRRLDEANDVIDELNRYINDKEEEAEWLHEVIENGQ